MAPVIQRADFYQSNSVLHPLIVGGIVLIVVFLYFRLSSSRSLAQLSGFSIVANICLGSTLSRIITQPDLHLTRGLISIFTIIIFEYVTDWLTVRHAIWEWVFRKDAVLLVFRGVMLEKVIKRHRITPEAVMATLRSNKMTDIKEAEAVVLELNGQFSVLSRLDYPFNDPTPCLDAVPGYTELRERWAEEHASERKDRQRIAEYQNIRRRQPDSKDNATVSAHTEADANPSALGPSF